MPRTRAQGLAQQHTGAVLSPPQSLPQTRRVRKRIVQPAAENDNSENQDFSIAPAPSPTLAEDKALVYIWVSPLPSTIAAKHTTVKANFKIVVPRDDILNFLDTYTFEDSDSTATVLASRKRRAEDAHEGSSPNKRARTETTPPSTSAPPTASAPPIASAPPTASAPSTAAAPPTIAAQRRARAERRLPTTFATRGPRTLRSPVRVLSVPAYDRHGNLVLAGDADDPELSLFEEVALYTANTTRSRLARFTRKNNTQRNDDVQEEVQHKESQAEPEAGEVALAVQPHDEGDAPIKIPTEIPTDPPVETPVQTPNRGWKIGSVLGSVRAASRLFPGFRRAPLNIADGNQNGTTNTPTAAHIDTPSITTATTTANGYIFTANSGVETSENIKQTDKHSRKKSSKASKKSSKSTEERKAAHKKRKQEKIDEQKTKEEERRKAMAQANKREIENEVARKVYYALKAEHEAAAATGVKRKRFSPKAIPNPVGCSYGMDLEFFGGDSDEEEEVSAPAEPELGPQPDPEPEHEPEPSPSLRVAKRVRFTADTRFPLELPSTPRQINNGGSHGSYHNAARNSTEYSNFPAVATTALSSERSSLLGSNIFNVAQQSHISAQPATTNRIFTVPYDSDSDESMDEPAYTDKGKGKGIDWSTRNVGSTKPWQQDPPPPPTPSHAALPAPKYTSMEEESLARLRSEALRFTPKQPSTLRSVSRLSSSTVASSDAGDNEQAIETPAQSKAATHEVFRNLATKAQADIEAQREAQAQQGAQAQAAQQHAHDEARQQAQYEAQAQAQQQAQNEAQAQARQQAQYEAQAQPHNQYQNQAQPPVASRGVLRELSGNNSIWVREMEAAQAKFGTESQQQQFHVDPMVTGLVNAIPDRDLIQFDPNIASLIDRFPQHDLAQFEFPGLGHSQMDPTVEALLNAIPDENLIRFEFPSYN